MSDYIIFGRYGFKQKDLNIDIHQYVKEVNKMEKQTALKTLFWITLAGVLFSGYLSYTEIFQQSCAIGTCNSKVFTIPSCVYGIVIYLMCLIISIIGLRSK